MWYTYVLWYAPGNADLKHWEIAIKSHNVICCNCTLGDKVSSKLQSMATFKPVCIASESLFLWICFKSYLDKLSEESFLFSRPLSLSCLLKAFLVLRSSLILANFINFFLALIYMVEKKSLSRQSRTWNTIPINHNDTNR
jgi:hypothetical protein